MLTVYCAKLEEHDTSKDLTSSEIDRLKAIKFQIGNDYLKEPEAIESLLVCSRKRTFLYSNNFVSTGGKVGTYLS